MAMPQGQTPLCPHHEFFLGLDADGVRLEPYEIAAFEAAYNMTAANVAQHKARRRALN